MSTFQCDWHRDISVLPHIISAILFSLALGGWWLGTFLILISLLCFISHIVYISNCEWLARRHHIGTNVLFADKSTQAKDIKAALRLARNLSE